MKNQTWPYLKALTLLTIFFLSSDGIFVSSLRLLPSWGVGPVLQRSSRDFAIRIRGGGEEELTLDQKVQKAMQKLGIDSSNNVDQEDSADTTDQENSADTTVTKEEKCEDGVCPLLEDVEKRDMAEGEAYDLAERIAIEMKVHTSLAVAAMGATSVSLESNGEERRYDEKAARNLIEQELTIIRNIDEESQQVKELVSEGYDPFLSRRALAFAEMNMEDARAILIADQMDEDEQVGEQRIETVNSDGGNDIANRIEAEKDDASNKDLETVEIDSSFDPVAEPVPPPVKEAPEKMPEPAKKSDVIFTATGADLQRLVMESPVPVLLDIYADWCGPCKALTPALEQMAVKAGGIFRLVKINSDNEKALSSALEVKALPTVFGIKDGKIVHMFQGMPKNEEFMKNFMMGLLMPVGTQPFDPPLKESEIEKYELLSMQLSKIASSACFSFSERELLQERISKRIDKLVDAHKGNLVKTEETIKIIRSLLSNIAKDPYNFKFRRINLTNKVIAEKVAKYPPSISILKCIGFIESEGIMTIGKGKKVMNVAPILIANSFLDKWIKKSEYQISASRRKQKDDCDRARLESEGAFEHDDEESECEEEIDPSSCELKVRLDGKKKIHSISLHADDPLSRIVDSLPIELDKEEEIQIICVAKRLITKSTDNVAMKKSLLDHGLLPSASIVIKVGGGEVTKSSDEEKPSSSLSERAALKKIKKKGSHTMQSIGIYSKDDNNKAELIDGGGGTWYEHDVTDDEEVEEEADTKEQEEDKNSEEEKKED